MAVLVSEGLNLAQSRLPKILVFLLNGEHAGCCGVEGDGGGGSAIGETIAVPSHPHYLLWGCMGVNSENVYTVGLAVETYHQRTL